MIIVYTGVCAFAAKCSLFSQQPPNAPRYFYSQHLLPNVVFNASPQRHPQNQCISHVCILKPDMLIQCSNMLVEIEWKHPTVKLQNKLWIHKSMKMTKKRKRLFCRKQSPHLLISQSWSKKTPKSNQKHTKKLRKTYFK